MFRIEYFRVDRPVHHEVHERSASAMRQWLADTLADAVRQGRSFSIQQMDMGVSLVVKVEFSNNERIHVYRSH